MLKFLSAFYLSLIIFTQPVRAEEKLRNLPPPDLSGGRPLMQVLNDRRTIRNFSSEILPDNILGEILWSAWGVSSADGKHTIPTSRNRQNLSVYALLPDGAWKYNPDSHGLERISDEDVRNLLNTQDFVKDAPLHLVYTGLRADEDNARLHAGSAYQNVGLYAASKGLNNVVRAYFDADAVAKALKLPGDEKVIVSQAVGFPQRQKEK